VFADEFLQDNKRRLAGPNPQVQYRKMAKNGTLSHGNRTSCGEDEI